MSVESGRERSGSGRRRQLDEEDETSVGRRHPTHLAEGLRPVRKVLEPQLTADHVEHPKIGACPLRRLPSIPLGRLLGFVEAFEPLPASLGSGPCPSCGFEFHMEKPGQAGDHAGAACDVQHTRSPGCEGPPVRRQEGPHRHQTRRYEMLLGDFRGRTAELPSLLLIRAAYDCLAVAEGARIPSIDGLQQFLVLTTA